MDAMRLAVLSLLLLPACFVDEPGLDEVQPEESSSSEGLEESSSSDGESEESSAGDTLAPLYGECDFDDDCEGYENDAGARGISCIASTCLTYRYEAGECTEGETAMLRADGGVVCALAADTSTGLAVCPDAMGAAVWEYDEATTATCWNAALVSGATCMSDDNCGGDTHCMGQPWYTGGEAVKLPNVCR